MSKNLFRRHPDLETLERLKRWPSLFKRFPRVRIYSAEHHAYWRGTGQGYTDDMTASDVWSIKEAFRRTCHCGAEKRIRYIPASTKYDTCTVKADLVDELVDTMEEIAELTTSTGQWQLRMEHIRLKAQGAALLERVKEVKDGEAM